MKKRKGPAALVLIALAADTVKPILMRTFSLRDDYTGLENLPVRVLLLFIGILWLLFFLSFYMSSNTGMAPYDALAYVMEEKWNIPFHKCRIMTDAFCVAVSFIIGCKAGNPWVVIGVTTIIMAFFTGPLVAFFRTHFAEPFFKRLGEH